MILHKDLADPAVCMISNCTASVLHRTQSSPVGTFQFPTHWLHEKFPLVLDRSVQPVSQQANSQLTTCPTYMAVKDRQAISTEVYSLAASRDPIGERVKEALDVIESALDAYTCVLVWPGCVHDADRFQTGEGIDQLQRRQGLCVDRLSSRGLC
jgi:hypothetical protein